MKRQDIVDLLGLLNRELVRINHYTSIFVCGGAVIALMFNSERRTNDIDGIFEDPEIIFELAHKIANYNGISGEWLNDNVKDILDINFLDTNYRIELSNLTIFYARPEYMLALKCLACHRGRNKDFEDVKLLVEYLKIRSIAQLLSVVSNYISTDLIYESTLRRISYICNIV